MTTPEFDYAIVGGGLAGLSLACHLIDTGLDGRRLVVLESRDRYEHDRIWCSWAAADHSFRSCVSHEWSRWSVRLGSRTVVRGSDVQPYRCIPSGRLYDFATSRIGGAEGAQLRMGQTVGGMIEEDDRVRVDLGDGTAVSAGMVFDSRPHFSRSGPRESAEIDWVQDFVGWRVRTSRDAFEPDCATLMDFAASSVDVRFVYVLPFSRREALVESTAFAPATVPTEEHEQAIRAHLLSRSGLSDFEILDRESGAIPMSTREQSMRISARRWRIGTAGGSVKASTGYSFETVQRWSRAAASQLAAGNEPPRSVDRGVRERAMDRMFLAFMQRFPERMPHAFARLFEGVDPDALVRFLSDRSKLRDAIAVARALPAMRMLRAAAGSWRTWMRA